jgi:hypothetical protein
MQQLERTPESPLSPTSSRDRRPATRSVDDLPLWRLNLMRVGYLVMGGGLVVFKWPLLIGLDRLGLAEGTVVCLLVGMSVLALLGLRHPRRMLPILLFEVTWKLIWLALVAVPQWADGRLEGAAVTQAQAILWVAIIIAVVPWRHVVTSYVVGAGDPWRRARPQ